MSEILSTQVRTVLLKYWDPIGVADEPAASDEYDAYIPELRRLLAEQATVERLAEYLSDVESRRMGLSGDPARARATARALKDLNRRT